MHNPVAFDIEYREHLRQSAWVNENDWQFPPPPRRNGAVRHRFTAGTGDAQSR